MCCGRQLFDKAVERISKISNAAACKRQILERRRRLKSIQNLPECIKRVALPLLNTITPIKLERTAFAAKNQKRLRADERVTPKLSGIHATVEEKTVGLISQQPKEVKSRQLRLNLFKSGNNAGRDSTHLSKNVGKWRNQSQAPF
jgi:hypothetical protein